MSKGGEYIHVFRHIKVALAPTGCTPPQPGDMTKTRNGLQNGLVNGLAHTCYSVDFKPSLQQKA